MLLLLVGWFVLACFLALLIGSAIEEGSRALSDAPGGVSPSDWDRVSRPERHIAHIMQFKRER